MGSDKNHVCFLKAERILWFLLIRGQNIPYKECLRPKEWSTQPHQKCVLAVFVDVTQI